MPKGQELTRKPELEASSPSKKPWTPPTLEELGYSLVQGGVTGPTDGFTLTYF